MDDPPANFDDWIANEVGMLASSEIWCFVRERAKPHEARSPEAWFEILRTEGKRLRHQGFRPLLLVWGRADPEWLRAWIQDPASRPPGMNLRQTRHSPQYLATINDVDVLATQEVSKGTSLLLCAELIRQIRFAEASNGRIVEVRFVQSDEPDPWQGQLEISFRLVAELREQPIVRLVHGPCTPA